MRAASERDLLPHEMRALVERQVPPARGSCGRRASRRRCAAACSGSTKGSRSTTGSCSRRAPGSGRRRRRAAALAMTAATYQHRVGREWRSVVDTTNDPILSARRPAPWRSWLRNEDYYSEGLLVWLDADTLIRERTNGRRSLDDFARAFFGIDDGSWAPVTYTFDDVVAALNGVLEHDWAAFFRERIYEAGTEPPLDGVDARRLSARVQGGAQRVPARSGGLSAQRRLQLFAGLELRRERQRHGRAVGRPRVQSRRDGRHAGRRRQRRLVQQRVAAPRRHGRQDGAERRSSCCCKTAISIEPSRSTIATACAIRTSSATRRRATA